MYQDNYIYRISQNEFLTPKWSVIYIFNCSPKETLLYFNYFNSGTINGALSKVDGNGSQIYRDYYNYLIERFFNETNIIQNR